MASEHLWYIILFTIFLKRRRNKANKQKEKLKKEKEEGSGRPTNKVSGPAYLSELLHVYSPSRTVPVAQARSISIPQTSNMIPVEVQKKFTIHGKCIQ